MNQEGSKGPKTGKSRRVHKTDGKVEIAAPKPVVSDARRAASSPLSAILPPLAGRILKAQGGDRRRLTEGALALDWPQIVGEDIARLCRPGKISPARGGGVTSLELLTRPAAALELTHLVPQLLERINRYFGYAYIGRLTFRHTTIQGGAWAMGAFGAGGDVAMTPMEPLDPASRAALEAHLAPLAESPLKAKLRALGERVIGHPRKKA